MCLSFPLHTMVFNFLYHAEQSSLSYRDINKYCNKVAYMIKGDKDQRIDFDLDEDSYELFLAIYSDLFSKLSDRIYCDRALTESDVKLFTDGYDQEIQDILREAAISVANEPIAVNLV